MQALPVSRLERVMRLFGILLVPFALIGLTVLFLWLLFPEKVDEFDQNVRNSIRTQSEEALERVSELRSQRDFDGALDLLLPIHESTLDVQRGDFQEREVRKIRQTLRELYLELGLKEEAADVARATVAQDPRDLIAHQALARLLLLADSGVEVSGLESMEQLEKFDPQGEVPGHFRIRDLYVRRLLERGDLEEAHRLARPLMRSWAEFQGGGLVEMAWVDRSGDALTLSDEFFDVDVSQGAFSVWTIRVQTGQLEGMKALRVTIPPLPSLRIRDLRAERINGEKHQRIALAQESSGFARRMKFMDGEWSPMNQGASFLLEEAGVANLDESDEFHFIFSSSYESPLVDDQRLGGKLREMRGVE